MEGALAEWRKILGMEVPAHVARHGPLQSGARPAFARRHDERGSGNAPSLKGRAGQWRVSGTSGKNKGGARPEAGRTLREAKEALEKDRGDVNAWLRLVRLTGESGDLEGAFGLLEQAAQRPESRLRRARPWPRRGWGRGDEAARCATSRHGQPAMPERPEYPLMLARLHEGRGRFEEALEWSKG